MWAAIMTGPGFYNHYDDPDEFWDDEPLEIGRQAAIDPAPAKVTSSPLVQRSAISGPPAGPFDTSSTAERKASNNRPTTSLVGVGMVSMKLDNDRLPVAVDVTRNLQNRLDPQDFSAAAMTGYYIALWANDAPIIARGKFSALSARPPLRSQMITLLQSRSRTEFEAVERALHGRDVFRADGPETQFGAPSVSVVANLSRISRIHITPEWAATVPVWNIARDIIDCANNIRLQRPTFHESGTWATRSDEELEHELRQYRDYLMRTQ